MNTVHALRNYFFQIHSNVIFPSTTRSSKCLQIYYNNNPTIICNHLTYWLLSIDRKRGRDTYSITPAVTILTCVSKCLLISSCPTVNNLWFCSASTAYLAAQRCRRHYTVVNDTRFVTFVVYSHHRLIVRRRLAMRQSQILAKIRVFLHKLEQRPHKNERPLSWLPRQHPQCQ